MNLQAILDTTADIARGAGEIIREHFGKPRHVYYKGETDLVTDADRAAEAYIAAALAKAFPEFGIVGEEGSQHLPPEGQYDWYVDPIDGTTNFAHRLPHFSVSIGLASRDLNPVLGVIYDPMRDELFTAYEGGGAFMNAEPIHVTDTAVLRQGLMTTGFPYDSHTDPENNLREWGAMVMNAQSVRQIGSSALDLAYVAAGRMDGYWEQKLNPWDCYAGIIITREAGGTVTDYNGEQEGLCMKSIRLVASNGHLHDDMLHVIQSVREQI